MIKLEAMGAIIWIYKKLFHFIKQCDRPPDRELYRGNNGLVHSQLNA